MVMGVGFLLGKGCAIEIDECALETVETLPAREAESRDRVLGDSESLLFIFAFSYFLVFPLAVLLRPSRSDSVLLSRDMIPLVEVPAVPGSRLFAGRDGGKSSSASTRSNKDP